MSVILFTRSSSKFSQMAAEGLLKRGHTVYLATDEPQNSGGLEELGGRIFDMSLADERQVDIAVNMILKDEGKIDVILNDATEMKLALFEGFDLSVAHDYFERQFWGPVRIFKFFLPQMRRQGSGRIINVRSISAEIPLPLGGWYSGAEQALQSLLASLRLEAHQFGISVTSIEIGKTFDRTAFLKQEEALSSQGLDDYRSLLAKVWRKYESQVLEEEDFVNSEADAVLDAVESTFPRNRYVVRGSAQLMVEARHSLSEEDFNQLILSQFGL